MTSLAYEAVLLLGFGGPEAEAEVVPFLERVTAGRGIPRERLVEVGQHYFTLGGVSPIDVYKRQITSTSGPRAAATAADVPWGRARKQTSCPARLSGVVAVIVRPASGVRCWWWVRSSVPALAPAVSAPIFTSGWPRSSRSNSPPAYPVAPATATEMLMRMTMPYPE